MQNDVIRMLSDERLERVCGGGADVYHRPIPEGSDIKKGARVYRNRSDSLEDDSPGNGADVQIVVRT